MKWITVTSPSFFDGEVSFLKLLLRHGVDLIHFRKPDATAEQCAEVLNRLTAEELSRVVVHQHFEQAVDFGLHGIHLNRRCPEPLPGFKGSVSRSCHSLAEVEEWKPRCQYVFLSPIFNSISKQGYKAAFTDAELSRAAADGIIDNRVYALGGVTPSGIPKLKAWHFGGAAMLGCVNSLALLPAEEAALRLEGIAQAMR